MRFQKIKYLLCFLFQPLQFLPVCFLCLLPQAVILPMFFQYLFAYFFDLFILLPKEPLISLQ